MLSNVISMHIDFTFCSHFFFHFVGENISRTLSIERAIICLKSKMFANNNDEKRAIKLIFGFVLFNRYKLTRLYDEANKDYFGNDKMESQCNNIPTRYYRHISMMNILALNRFACIHVSHSTSLFGPIQSSNTQIMSFCLRIRL